MGLRGNPGSTAEFITPQISQMYFDFTVNYQIRGETNSWWNIEQPYYKMSKCCFGLNWSFERVLQAKFQ